MKFLFLLALTTTLFAAPPQEVPPELYSRFTWDGQIPVTSYYFDESYPPTKPLFYNRRQIHRLIHYARAHRTAYYGKTDTYLYQALDSLIEDFNGSTVGILGSNKPWYESIALAYGAKPITVEYNKIITNHPDLTVMTVAEYDANPIQFDYLFSISSFEHDGLGRYGDPLDPDGDRKAMARAKRMLKPNGLLFLAVPIGQDNLTWNAHRVYGRLRLPYLLEDWDVVATFGFNDSNLDHHDPKGEHQPIFVLRPL